MSNTAITLQCPSCGGIFLTLQQSNGPMEICPHCAVSSPRQRFIPAQGSPQPRERTILPSRRAPSEPPRQFNPPATVEPSPSPELAPPPATPPAFAEPQWHPQPQLQPGPWEPAPQLPPQSRQGMPYLASQPSAPVEAPLPAFTAPPQQPLPPVAPQATVTPLPVLHFPTVGWDPTPQPRPPVAQPPAPELQPVQTAPATAYFNPGPVTTPAPPPAWPITPSPLPVAPVEQPPLSAPPSNFSHHPPVSAPPASFPSATPPMASPREPIHLNPFLDRSAAEPQTPSPEAQPPAGVTLAPVQPPPTAWSPPAASSGPSAPFPPASPANGSLAWTPGAPPIIGQPHPPVINHPPPVWPGLGLEEKDHRSHPFASLFAREGAAPAASPATPDATYNGIPATAQGPAGQGRRSPWLVVLLLAIIAGTFWYVWNHRAELLKLAPATSTQLLEPAAGAADSTFTPAAPPEAAVQTPVDPLEAATPDITHNIAAAEKAAGLVKALDSAASEQERLQVIANPEANRADVQRFFSALDNHLHPVLLDPTPAIVSPLQGGPKVRLFRLVTATCSKGAIMRLDPSPDGAGRLDWPLFVQTHEQRFDKFISSDRPPGELQAEWFSVLCKRRHDFDLPKEAQDSYLCLEAQGSLSQEGNRVLYVNKGLPAGRLLDSRLKWGEIYLADLLVGKGDISGKPVHVVLDCTGTDTARK